MMQIVSYPHAEYPGTKHEYLWLLVGGEDYSDGATAYHLSSDRDIDGDDCAGRNLDHVISEHGLDADEARQALESYRQTRGT